MYTTIGASLRICADNLEIVRNIPKPLLTDSRSLRLVPQFKTLIWGHSVIMRLINGLYAAYSEPGRTAASRSTSRSFDYSPDSHNRFTPQHSHGTEGLFSKRPLIMADRHQRLEASAKIVAWIWRCWSSYIVTYPMITYLRYH